MSTPISEFNTAVPWLAIYDGAKNPIIDYKYQVPIGMFMKSFKYEYTKEDCDNGQFVLETDNVDLVSNNKLKYLSTLILQWGWNTPSGRIIAGPVRSVVVKDHKISFTPSGVSLTVIFSDSSFIAKSIPAKYRDYDKNFTDYVTSLLKGQKVFFEILDFSTREEFEYKVTLNNTII